MPPLYVTSSTPAIRPSAERDYQPGPGDLITLIHHPPPVLLCELGRAS